MATRDTKENYNAYMRDYYKKNNQNKTTRINNKIDEIILLIINEDNNTISKRDLINKLIELKTIVKLPKMNLTVPDDITDFLNEKINNPLQNLK